MSNVSFEEEGILASMPPAQASQPALVKLVIRWGFAKDEKGAQAVLIGVIAVSVVTAIAVPLLMREKEIPLREPVTPFPVAPYAP